MSVMLDGGWMGRVSVLGQLPLEFMAAYCNASSVGVEGMHYFAAEDISSGPKAGEAEQVQGSGKQW